MPDQFVLAAVRQRELVTSPARPLFLAYALVSSHVPWSELPPVIDDWSTLGDGSIYRELPSTHYATEWLSLSGAKRAYADSIAYDLEVLRRYIRAFVEDDSLLVILGDHQPHSDSSFAVLEEQIAIEIGGQDPREKPAKPAPAARPAAWVARSYLFARSRVASTRTP